ncbi:hypothetical protein ACVWWG_005293 [Bradyrhizobium sp. LB7.2]
MRQLRSACFWPRHLPIGRASRVAVLLHLAGYPFVLKVFKTAKHSDFMLSMTSRVGRSSLKRLKLANAADYMSYMSGQTVGRDPSFNRVRSGIRELQVALTRGQSAKWRITLAHSEKNLRPLKAPRSKLATFRFRPYFRCWFQRLQPRPKVGGRADVPPTLQRQTDKASAFSLSVGQLTPFCVNPYQSTVSTSAIVTKKLSDSVLNFHRIRRRDKRGANLDCQACRRRGLLQQPGLFRKRRPGSPPRGHYAHSARQSGS